MIAFLLAAAFAATVSSLDPKITVSTLQACVARADAEYKAGDALPTRLKTAADSVDLCVAAAEGDRTLLSERRDATIVEFRYERARIEEAARRQPVRTATTSSTDPAIQMEIDRAREKLAPTPVQAVTPALSEIALTLESEAAGLEAVDAAIKAAKTEGRRYLTVRDALWLMDCNGEIVLEYPEGMPMNSALGREGQCEQLRRKTVASTR